MCVWITRILLADRDGFSINVNSLESWHPPVFKICLITYIKCTTAYTIRDPKHEVADLRDLTYDYYIIKVFNRSWVWLSCLEHLPSRMLLSTDCWALGLRCAPTCVQAESKLDQCGSLALNAPIFLTLWTETLAILTTKFMQKNVEQWLAAIYMSYSIFGAYTVFVTKLGTLEFTCLWLSFFHKTGFETVHQRPRLCTWI